MGSSEKKKSLEALAVNCILVVGIYMYMCLWVRYRCVFLLLVIKNLRKNHRNATKKLYVHNTELFASRRKEHLSARYR